MVSERWVVKLTAEGDSARDSYYACKDSPSRLTSKQSRAWIFSRYDALTEANTWGRSWEPRIVRLRPKAPVKPLTSPVSPEDVAKVVAALNADIHDYAKWAATCFVEREGEIRKAERERIAASISDFRIFEDRSALLVIGGMSYGFTHYQKPREALKAAILAATWPAPAPEPKTGEKK